jgi:NDP-sugar pyrophosphorylase family protein
MDALILAAGEGIRLRPLTYLRPKPLLPILNRPLLQWTLEYLNWFSIDRVILNTHHLAGQFETCLPSLDKGGIRELVTRYEPQILNTGGGLVNTRDFFRSDPFLVISGDILTDIDLIKAVDFHQRHNDPVTLVLHDYPEFNQIKVDSQGRILKLRKGDIHGLDFANIHILDRTVFNLLPASGSFDITPAYQKIIDEGVTVRAYVSQDHYWRNIGTPRSYLKAHEELLTAPRPPLSLLRGTAGGVSQLPVYNRYDPSFPRKRESRFKDWIPDRAWNDYPGKDSLLQFTSESSPNGNSQYFPRRIFVHPEATIEKGVEFFGWACVGKGCRLKAGCRIKNSVLWEEVIMESGSSVSESILGLGVHLKNNLQSEVLI